MRQTLLLSCVALCLSEMAPHLPNFTGYVVTAQWDGRTVPDVQWALDVTRQDTEFRMRQELKLIQLIPTTKGDASHFTYTAYDETSRTYWTSVKHNESSGSIWAQTIHKDVENVTALRTELRFAFPQYGATFVGLEIFNNKGTLVPLALFKDGTVITIDTNTGATTVFARLVNATTQFITNAIELDPVTQKLWVIGEQQEGQPNRFMITLDLNTKAITSAVLQPLKDHNPMLILPFDMVWLPTLKVLFTFYTGNFDQLIYISPDSGMMSFGTDNMANYEDGNGHYEFTADDFLEDDDMWSNSCVDHDKGLIYFQCTSVDPTSGEGTISLCVTPILPELKQIPYINTRIQPMTYGYAGMQYVQVVQ